MPSGNHVPSFLTGDTGTSPIVTYAPTTPAPTTAVTAAPTTEAPATAYPGLTVLGTRVAGTFVYRPDKRWLVARCWAELINRQIGTRALQARSCTMRVYDEAGNIVGGAVVEGQSDQASLTRVVFVLKGFVPEHNHAYIARVTLQTVEGSVIGTRTFPLPVN